MTCFLITLDTDAYFNEDIIKSALIFDFFLIFENTKS